MPKYILKKGVPFSSIREGTRVSVKGDGKGAIELTEAQAVNFANKLLSGEPQKDAELLGPASAAEEGPATSEAAAVAAKDDDDDDDKPAAKPAPAPAPKPAGSK